MRCYSPPVHLLLAEPLVLHRASLITFHEMSPWFALANAVVRTSLVDRWL
jgi:hypothetical protein